MDKISIFGQTWVIGTLKTNRPDKFPTNSGLGEVLHAVRGRSIRKAMLHVY